MARIKLPTVSELTAEQQQQYARFPANLTLGLLKTSRSAQGYLSLGASFPAGRLCDKDREMIILRVGALSHSAYERMQHYPLAILAGWHDDDIKKIEQGGHQSRQRRLEGTNVTGVERLLDQDVGVAFVFQAEADGAGDASLAALAAAGGEDFPHHFVDPEGVA